MYTARWQKAYSNGHPTSADNHIRFYKPWLLPRMKLRCREMFCTNMKWNIFFSSRVISESAWKRIWPHKDLHLQILFFFLNLCLKENLTFSQRYTFTFTNLFFFFLISVSEREFDILTEIIYLYIYKSYFFESLFLKENLTLS